MGHQTYVELPDGGYAIAHGDEKPSPEAEAAIRAVVEAAYKLFKEPPEDD